MKIKYRYYTLSILMASMMAWGCKSSQLAIDDHKHQALPDTYTKAGDSTINVAETNWRIFFEDEKLRHLIEVALENNQEVQKTLENIRIASAYLRLSKVGVLPEVNVTAGSSMRRFGDYTMDGVGNADTNLSETVPADKKLPDPYKDFILGAEFNWELDIWGRYGNLKRSAASRWMASQEMANSAKTWLIAEVANLYYEMLGLDEEVLILEKNIAYQQTAFELSKDLKQTGKENQLAVDQFEAQLLNSQALLVQKKRELRSLELALKGLLGVYTEKINRGSLSASDFAPHIINTGVPADLLQYRPDIRRAERELAATKADVAVAKAAFFPSLRLFGMAGFNAFDFSKLFLNPGSSVYQLGAGLVAPIFNRSQIRTSFETAKSQQRIAFLEYEQTILTGYLEVLDRINAYSSLEEQLMLKNDEVQVQRRSVDNANTMFSVGYANYLEVINSQRRALEAELEYVELRKEQLQNIVMLYKSLGGGWM